ncbi:MAG TPA: glycine cleavage T C-terminal barrel domain-containing protein [Pyrinomonadaceae bacterium]|nr:hypothetical protein [Chloracidobacterium sp.]MBP9934678.1 hypothetical protein [Pyrinomonadaceae bacterium]MBK7804616.1 hypothetical protein [Chloracidobacterium sp.]MBK9439059.1 hypothetical protein [Chloracidobacterium sp.]MBK9769166.1 hypothetical protein [Chloracidobacterium sp.]
MEPKDISDYQSIQSEGAGYFEQERGLICVWGRESVQFLDGLISNDMKTLGDGAQMLAAFPNAQGRLLAVVRVLRQGDRFFFETEAATREKVFQNLFRFTFAGDFYVEDVSDQYRFFELFGDASETVRSNSHFVFASERSSCHVVDVATLGQFTNALTAMKAVEISAALNETLRIENGIPKFGIDMDENTIVPELGLDGLISYNKGCYIGQEIIARIYFRGHVAKRLSGLVLDSIADAIFTQDADLELTSTDGKNAGRIKSLTYSPKIGKTIALAFIRYDYLEPGTELVAGGIAATVTALPF